MSSIALRIRLNLSFSYREVQAIKFHKESFKYKILDLILAPVIILLFVKSASEIIQNTLINLKKFVFLKTISPHQTQIIWLLLATCYVGIVGIVYKQ